MKNKSLDSFLSLNSSIEKVEETEHINLDKLWSETAFMCRFDKSESFDSIASAYLPLEFSAIMHKDKGLFEFIFTPMEETEPFLKRKFQVSFGQKNYDCFFAPPSEGLVFLATHFKLKDDQPNSNYRNLRIFRDYYKTEMRSKGADNFFQNKLPYSFFIKGDFESVDLVNFAKHINFFMRFFDRSTPQIEIHTTEPEKEKFKLPCYSNNNDFPETIQGRVIDPIIIDLLNIAAETANIRLKYIFYYQILEYCSYYHLNEELKRKFNNIIKRPDVLSNSGYFSRIIVEEFKNYFKTNDDKQKLEKLISDFLEYDDIKEEIKCNSKYFTQDIEFDGGFKIKALIKEEKEVDSPSTEVLKNITDRIDKIRNVLVHIRESRENKVILPTRKNSHQLIPYLYLIRRIAENIAFKYE
jgi:hypothetical protein